MPPIPSDSRARMLDAALAAFRRKGYTATTVDDICAATGLSKGSFFHHFKGKEDLALAAVGHWNGVTGALFAQAPYQQVADPRARLLAYLDFRAALLQGELPDVTCLLGTLVQETYATHPAIRDACGAGIAGHAATLLPTIEAAKARYAPRAEWTAESLALFTQAALQGAFVVAKSQGSARAAEPLVAHLRAYVQGLLGDGLPAPTPRPRRKA
ncbi:MAG: TetR/AcrR family transcriptional regulator [Burkholderiales bacterium]|nr:TetR/AcrR family transcriptional regulator [Burkholderiales bacterium]